MCFIETSVKNVSWKPLYCKIISTYIHAYVDCTHFLLENRGYSTKASFFVKSKFITKVTNSQRNKVQIISIQNQICTVNTVLMAAAAIQFDENFAQNLLSKNYVLLRLLFKCGCNKSAATNTVWKAEVVDLTNLEKNSD